MYYARALNGGQIELSNGGLISGAFSSDTTLSTPVAINKGGTGQTTSQAALDALAAASGSLVQGDVFIVDSSGNVVRLARGSDNQTLMMNGSNPNWETVSAGGATVEIVEYRKTATFTTTDTDFADITDMELTKPNITDGKCMATCEGTIDNNTANNGTAIGIDDNGTVVAVNSCITTNAGLEFPIAVADVSDADGNTLQAVIKAHSQTARILYDAGKYEPKISVIGVG